MPEYPKICVAVAVLNEEKSIEACLRSLMDQRYEGEVEIIVADGGSTDGTREIVRKLREENSNLILINNSNKIQAAGRNLAWQQTDAQYLAYLDGKRVAAQDWLSELYKAYISLEASGVEIGAVGSVHFRKNDSGLQKASDIAFRSVLSGAGENHFLNSELPMETHHATMCLYKRETLDKFGYYDERFPIGEDIELNNRLALKRLKPIYVIPTAVNFYEYRNNFSSLFKQQYLYGVWRFGVMRKLGKYFPIPFAAGLAVIFELILLILGMIFPSVLLAFFLNILAYLSLVFGFSLQIAIKNKINIFTLTGVFVAIHAGYGIGAVIGILKFILGKNKFA